MKAGVERAKLVRSLRQESRRLRLLVLVIGFFLVTLTFIVVSKPDALLFNLNGGLSVDQAPRSLLICQRVDGTDASQRSAGEELPKMIDDEEDGEGDGEASSPAGGEGDGEASSPAGSEGDGEATPRLGLFWIWVTRLSVLGYSWLRTVLDPKLIRM